MRQQTSTLRNLRIVKALRGQSLTIDLGKTFTGTISAWLKRDSTDSTYRSFTVVDGRFLFLSKEKTQDYLPTDLVEGKWYFDVRHLPAGQTDPNLEEVVMTGTIQFSNHITDSNGTEIAQTPETESGMINLSNTSSVYGTVGQVIKAEDFTSKIYEVKTIKAMRAESLSIDLGKTYAGFKLEAWMKKDPNDSTYRSFTIVDDRYIFLPKSKTQDYYDVNTGLLIESIAGKWHFDVRAIPTSATKAEDEQIVLKGVILFEENITDSGGQELVYSEREFAKDFLSLEDTPFSYSGQEGQILKVNSTEDGLEFNSIEEDKHFTFDQGMPSAIWTIPHTLGKYVSVIAVDSAGSVVVGQINYVDINNITITFNSAFSGSAYLN